jgi:hypothetical protein
MKRVGGDEGLWWVLAEEIEPGPIRHEQIDGLLPVLRWTWRHLEKYIDWCRTFEDWELGFMRERDPAAEVVIWVKATYAFLEFTHRHRSMNKAAVFGAICSMLRGQSDSVKPKHVARQLKKLMSKGPGYLGNVENFTTDGHLKTGDKHLR